MAAVNRTKLINTSRVMREIWVARESSRVEIARELGLDKSTVSSIVADLLDLGVIIETREGEAGPQGGRKPVHITLNQAFGCVLGLELRPESYSAVGVDLAGEIVFSRFEKMQINGDNIENRIAEIVSRQQDEIERTGLPLLGIGNGLSGVIDPEIGAVRYSIPLKLDHELNLYQSVGREICIPFFIENDANACAWGELAFHRRRDLRDFLFLLVELRDIESPDLMEERTSVGMGIVIDGRVHYGAQHSAGEFRSIYRNPESKSQFSLTPDEAFRLTDDPTIMGRFLKELAQHVALFVNTFNLSHVFVGGNLDSAYSSLKEKLEQEIEINWPYPDKHRCEIAISSLGDRSVAYGAAGMVLERMFADLETMSGLRDIRNRQGELLHGWPVRA